MVAATWTDVSPDISVHTQALPELRHIAAMHFWCDLGAHNTMTMARVLAAAVGHQLPASTVSIIVTWHSKLIISVSISHLNRLQETNGSIARAGNEGVLHHVCPRVVL